jgi:excisionase family DNA binding protein
MGVSMNDKSDLEPLMTVDEVAEWVRLAPGTIRQKVKARDIPFVKIGRNTRFRRADIERWIKEHPATETESADLAQVNAETESAA